MKQLDDILLKYNLYIDKNKNIYPREYNNDYSISLLNNQVEAISLLNISANICGWLTENTEELYFQLSLFYSYLSENKYILLRMLELQNISNDNLDNIYSLHNFDVNNSNIYKVHIEKVKVLELINFLLVYEEFGSFLSLSNNTYKLLNINDGLVSFTTNDSVTKESTVEEIMETSLSDWSNWIWEIDEN